MSKKDFTATVSLGPSTFNPALPSRITFNREQERQAGYKNEHPLIEEKIIPKSLELLRTELAQPRHQTLSDEAKKGTSFENSLVILAARLDIALDGEYDAGLLCDVLYKALRARKPGAIQNHHLRDARLKDVELVEKSEVITLEEKGDKLKIKGGLREAASGEGPYTICRTCITSFDCISERSCKHGTPAQQLGNTMKVLKTLKEIK